MTALNATIHRKESAIISLFELSDDIDVVMSVATFVDVDVDVCTTLACDRVIAVLLINVVGVMVGSEEGWIVGYNEGSIVGSEEGLKVGALVGNCDGCHVGFEKD